MPPQDTDTRTVDQIQREEVESLIRSLSILLAAYEPSASVDVTAVDSRSYASGFRAGARSAYADAVCRLQELRSKAAAVA